jgi:hypothetical protein
VVADWKHGVITKCLGRKCYVYLREGRFVDEIRISVSLYSLSNGIEWNLLSMSFSGAVLDDNNHSSTCREIPLGRKMFSVRHLEHTIWVVRYSTGSPFDVPCSTAFSTTTIGHVHLRHSDRARLHGNQLVTSRLYRQMKAARRCTNPPSTHYHIG